MDTFTVVVTVLCWAWIGFQGIAWLVRTGFAVFAAFQAFDNPWRPTFFSLIIFTFVFGLLASPAIAILCLI